VSGVEAVRGQRTRRRRPRRNFHLVKNHSLHPRAA
jgi:hypothetical protein